VWEMGLGEARCFAWITVVTRYCMHSHRRTAITRNRRAKVGTSAELNLARERDQ